MSELSLSDWTRDGGNSLLLPSLSSNLVPAGSLMSLTPLAELCARQHCRVQRADEPWSNSA